MSLFTTALLLFILVILALAAWGVVGAVRQWRFVSGLGEAGRRRHAGGAAPPYAEPSAGGVLGGFDHSPSDTGAYARAAAGEASGDCGPSGGSSDTGGSQDSGGGGGGGGGGDFGGGGGGGGWS